LSFSILLCGFLVFRERRILRKHISDNGRGWTHSNTSPIAVQLASPGEPGASTVGSSEVSVTAAGIEQKKKKKKNDSSDRKKRKSQLRVVEWEREDPQKLYEPRIDME
jgi:hypothetical protein